MANNDTLSFSWELKGRVEEQIKQALSDTEKFNKVLQEIAKNSKKGLTLDEGSAKAFENVTKNIQEAEKALYKLMDAREKAEKAMSRNRGGGFGFDDTALNETMKNIDLLINRIVSIGETAGTSKTAVKDLMASMSGDVLLRDAKSRTSTLNKDMDKRERAELKAMKEEARELAKAQKDAESAAARNAAAQERVKDALAKIATARANLTAASERGNQQEVTHAQLLISLLDRLSGKLSSMKGQFLGEKGALDGVLGGGYRGLMRNVSQAINDIGRIESSALHGAVSFDRSADLEKTAGRIAEVRQAMDGLGKSLNNLIGKQVRQPDDSRLLAIREMQEGYAQLRAELIRLTATYNQLKQAERLGDTLGLGHLRGYTGPKSALSDEAWTAAKKEAEIREVATQAAERHRQKLEELTAAFERQARAEERERQAQAQVTAQQERSAQRQRAQNQARQEATQATRKQAEELVRLRLELLKTQQAELLGVLKNGKGVLDAASLEATRQALINIRSEMHQIQIMMQNMGSYSTQGLFTAGRGAQNWSPFIAHQQGAIEASNAVQQLTESERRFVEQIAGATQALGPHLNILGDLQTMAAQYLSLWGARSIINNIIETGGLLEQQRLSIGAILGDIDKAEEIFNQIKDLAVKSPFGVVELDKMTKQLTAYGFQYEELFDWTKRLADISAATGTEVSRLALALGHVRSEGALSGYTLRQFAMGNIPMLGKLAESRGVSTKEIRALVRKKEISDKEVEDVLKGLTDEGGMFFNAQEVMSQALNAKFKNLRDAFDIMYGEIAESGIGDLLKDIATGLTTAAKQWQRFGSDIAFVAGLFIAVKAAIALYTAALGKSTAGTIKSALQTKKQEAAQLKLAATYRRLTAEERRRIINKDKLVASDIKAMIATKKMTTEELLRAVAMKKVSREEALIAAKRLQVTKEFTLSQKRMLIAQLQSMQHTRKWVMIWTQLGMTIERAAAAAWSFTKMMAPMAALTAVFDVFSSRSQQKEAAGEMAENQTNKILGDVKALNDIYVELSKKAPSTEDERVTAIDNMVEGLKEAGFWSESLEKTINEAPETQKYDILYNRLEEISKAYLRAKDSAKAYFEAANDVGGGVFWNDNMMKDMKDYSEANIERLVARDALEPYTAAVRNLLQKSLGKAWKDAYAGMDITDVIDDAFIKNENRNALIRMSKFADEYPVSSKAIIDYISATQEANKQLKEVEGQLPESMKKVNAAYNATTFGLRPKTTEIQKWAEEDIRAYVKHVMDYLSQLNIDSDATSNLLGLWSKMFFGDQETMEKYLEPEKEKLEEWQIEMQKYFDEHHIDVKIMPEDDMDAIGKRLKDKKDEIQKYMNSHGAIMLKFGITLEDIPTDIEKFLTEKGFKKGSWVYEMYHQALSKLGKFAKTKEGIEQAEADYPGIVAGDEKDPKKTKGNKKDTGLEALKNRVDLYKKFYGELDNARRMYGEGALEWLKNNGFADVFGWNISDVTNFSQALDELTKGFNANTEARKKFVEGVDADKVTQRRREEADALKDYVDELVRMANIQKENYATYKKWYELTGDAGLSAAMSGVTQNTTYADYLKGDMAGKTGARSIDEVLGMSQEEVKKAFGEGSEVYKIWDLYRQEQENITKELEGKMYDATQKLLTTEEQILAIDQKIADLRKDGAGANDPRIMAFGRDRANLAAKAFEESEPYLRFYAAVLSMTNREAEAAGESIKENLIKQLAEGTITADKYMKSLKNVNSQLSSSRGRKSGLMALMSGGVKGYLQNLGAQRTDNAASAAIVVQMREQAVLEARKELHKVTQTGDKEAIRAAELKLKLAEGERDLALKRLKEQRDMLGITDEQLKSMNDILAVIEMISGIIDGLQQSAQQISDMFQALGQDERAAGWSDAADFIGAIGSPIKENGSALKSLMNGDVGGVLSHTVGMFTAPITAFAKLHDKKREREIVKSQRAVKELTIEYQNLQKAMERALGGIYTTGGYNEMLKNLTAQRNEIQRQYELEQDKKDNDADKLTDYKQQLNELDIQIKDFAMDFAKAIYDIDLHSWASELTNAIVEAWEKGEDAVKAYRDKVKDLMKDLLKNILAKKVMERAIEALGIDTFIANELVNDDGKLNEGAIPKLVDMLYQVADTTSTAIYNAFDEAEAKGYIDRGDSSSSSSSSIKSARENVDDLLLSYINAIRLDVSMKRMMMSKILDSVQGQTQMPEIARAQLEQLRQITENTRQSAIALNDMYNMMRSMNPDGDRLRVKVV